MEGFSIQPNYQSMETLIAADHLYAKFDCPVVCQNQLHMIVKLAY